MVHQNPSPSPGKNVRLEDFPRQAREGNLKWFQRAYDAMNAPDTRQWTLIVLLGGSDTLAFRLRVAQGHLRSDMLPSFWSEAILADVSEPAAAKAIHVPLDQPGTPEFPPRQNGVVVRPLKHFDDKKRYPNIALVALPISQHEVLDRIAQFRRSRSTLDAMEHVLRWLAFAWGVARAGNPLHESYGLPSACMLETVCAAAGFDLTPGLESRASCPEAIWQAALRWHEYYRKSAREMPYGRVSIAHKFPIIEPPLPATELDAALTDVA